MKRKKINSYGVFAHDGNVKIKTLLINEKKA